MGGHRSREASHRRVSTNFRTASIAARWPASTVLSTSSDRSAVLTTAPFCLGVVLFLATAPGRAAAAFVLFVVVLAMIALARVGVRMPSQSVDSFDFAWPATQTRSGLSLARAGGVGQGRWSWRQHASRQPRSGA